MTAYDFDHGGILNNWKQSTAVYVGPATTRPSFDARGTILSPTTAQISVSEDQYIPLQLPAGRYWLVDSKTATIDVVSCTAGAVTGHPSQRDGSPSPSA